VTLLGGFLATRNAAVQASPLDAPMSGAQMMEWFGGFDQTSHARVNEYTALGLAAVWRAMQLTCNVPASLPFHAYKQNGDSRVLAGGQSEMLMSDPHPDMTPFEFWQTVYMHRRLWGNAYVRKLTNRLGQYAELWPVHPSRVAVGRESEAGRKVYAIDGGAEVLSDDQILHLPGIGYDGICGVSPIRAARESVGLGLSAQRFGGKFYENGALATGVLQTEQRLTQTQADQLSKRWQEKRSGMTNAYGTIVLDKNAKFTQLSIAPGDAQFLESRRFQITEVCRWFGLPPFLMFETETSTSWGTGLEQQALAWVKFDLQPELTAVEQRVTKHVLRPGSVYARYSIEGLLRGDTAARAAFYKAMWEVGALSTNEIRAFEEQPAVEGGDVRYRPLNMGQLGTTDTASTPATPTPKESTSA
jgi:HK97 family phage portal protein